MAATQVSAAWRLLGNNPRAPLLAAPVRDRARDDMSTAKYLIGDVYDRLAEIPDGSIDLVVTSPPFLALRSYLPADHPDKAKEIGSEPTPAAFLDTLLALSAEWRRVLAPHGSIAVELGDTYAGNVGWSGDDAKWKGRDGFRTPGKDGTGWPSDKSLCGIPTLYAWSLAYGRNLLTGEPSPAGQWRVRNLLCWARPNPPVGALGDKWRPATSYVAVACVGRSRFFDLDAVRTAGSPNTHACTAKGVESRKNTGKSADDEARGGNYSTLDVVHDTNGAPPLDWIDERELAWEPLLGLPTQPYSGSHYATFPTQLPKRLIECMCPQRVCTECGKPSERITSVGYEAHGVKNPDEKRLRTADALTNPSAQGMTHGRASKVVNTLGWTVCDCNVDEFGNEHGDFWRSGVVLDPFAGSGTTLAAATGLGRACIGIDLDERNADLARDRVGMFLEVDEGQTAAR